MKKTITSFFMMLACAFSAQAQTSYPFDAADVDENGWLWFDTPEKIDKYVGVSKDGKLDPDGKIFQLITTESASGVKPPFNETFASDTISGFGDPHNAGTDIRKGAIVLHQATENGKFNNGGAVLINLPSCKNINMVLSCESSAQLYLSGSKDATADTSTYTIVYQPEAAVFPPGFFIPLFTCNIYNWNDLQTFNNKGATDFTLASKEPVFALLQVAGLLPVYIHGIRIQTEQSTGIQELTSEKILFDGQNVSLNNPARISVYHIDGSCVLSEYTDQVNLSGLPKGLYLVKAGQATQKIVIK